MVFDMTLGQIVEKPRADAVNRQIPADSNNV
jgi:hypothetical protein